MVCAIGMWAMLMYPIDGGPPVTQGCFADLVSCTPVQMPKQRSVSKTMRSTGPDSPYHPWYSCEEVTPVR